MKDDSCLRVERKVEKEDKENYDKQMNNSRKFSKSNKDD